MGGVDVNTLKHKKHRREKWAKMINMQDLQKILKLVELSANVKNAKPVSMLVISKSGNGKTELIRSFKKNSIAFETDITYFGLLDLLDKNQQIKHLIIPDFIKITQKKRATSDNFVSLLNALTEEGIDKFDFPNGKHYEFNNRRLGLITATTKDSFNQKKGAWQTFGFVQRMLIVSYDYNDDTIEKIIDSINGEEYIKDKSERIVLGGKDVKTERSLNKQLNKYANKNFRSLKHLQTLAKSNALLNKRDFVTQEDIDEIIRLTKYMNLNYTKI